MQPKNGKDKWHTNKNGKKFTGSTKMIEMRTDAPQFAEYPKYWTDRAVPKYLYMALQR
jgi:hypothetical protein